MRGIATLLIVVGLAFGFMSLGAFVDESVARRALETQGYSDISITDKTWFFVGLRGCDSRDAVRFVATATNPVGRPVQVYVCTGLLFKGSTIRT